MSLFLPVRRATLLIPSGPVGSDSNKKHLFILLTDPTPVSGPLYDNTGVVLQKGASEKQILMVSISTLKPQFPHDPTCLLYQGDHPFIKHDSYVKYSKARIEGAEGIMRGIKNGVLIQHDPVDTAIFARICHGLTQSRFTTPKVLAFYEAATKP